MLVWKSIVEFFKDKSYRELLFTSVIIIGIGTVVFRYLEGWRWLDSAYFCVITLTTIGYGDFSPKTDAGKIFNMFYVLIGLGLILSFIRTVYEHYYTQKSKSKKEKTIS